MHIISITLDGFQSYTQRTTFEFQEGRNYIHGSNGQGKSSLMHAISIALLNRSAFGEAKIESCISMGSEQAYIAMVFETDAGTTHTVERIITSKKTTLMLDGAVATQGDLDKLIGKVDAFLSIFNPGYFHNELSDTDRRELIMSNMPPPDYHELWQRHVGDLELMKKYNINFAKSDEQTRISKLFKNLETQRVSKVSEKTTLTSELSLARSENKQGEVAPVSKEQFESAVAERAELTDRASRYGAAYAALAMENRNIERCENALLQFGDMDLETAQTTAKMPPEAVQAKREQYTIQPPIPITENCSTCGSSLTAEQIEQIKAKNAEIEINNNVSREKIQVADNFLVKIQMAKEYMRHYQELESCKAVAASNEAAIVEALNGQTPEELNAKMDELSKLIQQYENHAAVLAAQEKSAQEHQERIVRMRSRINNIDDEIAALDEEIALLKRIYDAIKGSGTIKADIKTMYAAAFAASMENCSVVLERTRKNGETEECFEITYHDKPFRRLSNAEKMHCSMEVGRFLAQQTGMRFPVFVDNAEGINHISEEDFADCPQWFEAYVSDGAIAVNSDVILEVSQK